MKTLVYILVWGGFAPPALLVAFLAGMNVAAGIWYFVIAGILWISVLAWIQRGVEKAGEPTVPIGRHFAE